MANTRISPSILIMGFLKDRKEDAEQYKESWQHSQQGSMTSKSIVATFNWKIFGLALVFTVIVTSLIPNEWQISENQDSKASNINASERKTPKPFQCPDYYLDKNKNDVCADASNKVEVLGWSVQVDKISQGESFLGKELCFSVYMVNNGTEARSFSESDFRLRWPSGQVRDFWTDFTTGTLGSAPLSVGGYAKGKVCFEEPGEKGEHMLIFKPGWTSERGIWFFNLS